MSKPKPKICPLLSASDAQAYEHCQGDRCAWFHLEYHQDGDFTHGECALVRIADRLANVQTFGHLDKKTAADATNTADR